MRTIIWAENVIPTHFLADAMLTRLRSNNGFGDTLGKDCPDEIFGALVLRPGRHHCPARFG
jgi:hypothetical protein